MTNLKARYSSTFGASFGSAVSIGTITGLFGLDSAKIGQGLLVGIDGTIMLAATNGGTFTPYVSTLPAGAKPTALWWPRYQFGSTLADNSGASPQFLMASSTLAGGAALWKYASGTFTPITPTVGGVKGLAVSQDCIAMPWFDASRIASVLSFGGNVHLQTSVNAGSSHVDRGTLTADANYVRYRPGDTSLNQLFIADGTQLKVSPTHGANLINKSIAGSLIIGVEPLG